MKNHSDTPPDSPDIDQTRRRLTKAGLAAPAVLGVLVSRPVLGDSLHHCTPSGHISGFASPNPNATDCGTLGLAPEDFQSGPDDWPAGGAFTRTQGGNLLPLDFKAAPAGYSVLFANAYEVRKTSNNNFVRDATLWDVLMGAAVNSANGDLENSNYLTTKSGFADPNFTLGMEAVAACMNAVSKYPQGFPIDAVQVVNMFNNVIDGGTDPVTSTANWNRTEVIEYFQSLHG